MCASCSTFNAAATLGNVEMGGLQLTSPQLSFFAENSSVESVTSLAFGKGVRFREPITINTTDAVRQACLFSFMSQRRKFPAPPHP